MPLRDSKAPFLAEAIHINGGSAMKSILKRYTETSLILRIVIGIIIGAILALTVPQAEGIGMLGTLFVGALKAIAPVLVAVLVAGSLCQSRAGLDRRFGLVVCLYVLSTYLASFAAVIVSFLFPQRLSLSEELIAEEAGAAPGGLGEIITSLLNNIIANPVASVANANYLGILFWAVIVGLALKKFASPETQTVLMNLSDAITEIVRWIINLAPFGICGLVFSAVSESGFDIFTTYGRLMILLVCTMLIVALGGGENTAQQITALIMAGATVIGYVLGEGLADAGNKPEDGTDQ